ncbi:hypothetical protein JY538_07185 [Serratia marcescens]|uniref:hypothetical protein n=1 Tax=Serratia sarumanii TaxID=3020826 RepID=UPI003D7E3B0A|nr:hypothetical protein [Serratia marcescens]
MLELKPEQLAQIRADIAARKEMPDYGQSVAGNMERLRVIADTRETFSTEAVEMLVKALDGLVANREEAKPVAEVRLVDEFCGCCQRPDVEWLGMAGDQFPVGTKFYTAQPATALSEDVESVVGLLESGEWAEHCTNTVLGQRLESAVTALVSDATPAPAKSNGFKLVPTVPTPEMIAAAMNCDDVTFINLEDFCVNFGNIYAAMLAAAPGKRE